MANPAQIAVVTANGQKYDTWTELEATRSCVDIIDHAMLTVAEISPETNNAISTLKLNVGDSATVSLAGKQILNGMVYLRQGILTANQHAVQIGICSMSQSAMVTTTTGEPGQYVNQTLQQIGNAVFGKAGLKFTATSDDGIPFPRVSEHIGESIYSFIERLCRMKNLHLIDDGKGGLVAFRGSSADSLLVSEGKEILKGRILLKVDDHIDQITVKGHDANNDSADTNRSPKGTATSDPPIGRQLHIMAEEMGNASFMQHRANHQSDWDKLMQVDGEVTVTGWFAPGGTLWWNKVTSKITVKSPSMLPADTKQFMIKGVVHRQSSQNGTTTDLLLCREDGYGSGMADPLVQQQ